TAYRKSRGSAERKRSSFAAKGSGESLRERSGESLREREDGGNWRMNGPACPAKTSRKGAITSSRNFRGSRKSGFAADPPGRSAEVTAAGAFAQHRKPSGSCPA